MTRTMMCFQLLAVENKSDELLATIDEVANAQSSDRVFLVDPNSFNQFPGAPFCYWPSPAVQAIFQRLPAFESEERKVRCGMGTLDDFRFIRCWWEVDAATIAHTAANTVKATAYVPYAKGGSASPFWSPIPLVVRYTDNGSEVKTFVELKVGSASRKIQSQGFYFRAGLAFGRRTRRLSPACLPAGTIFSDGSNAVFFPRGGEPTLWSYLGFLNSRSVRALFTMCAPARKMEVGYLQRMPVPELDGEDGALGRLAREGFQVASTAAQTDSLQQLFVAPSLQGTGVNSLTALSEAVESRHHTSLLELNRIESELELLARRTFGLSERDVTTATPPTAAVAAHDVIVLDNEDDVDEDGSSPGPDGKALCLDFLEYALGCVVGRWDVRYATGEKAAPELLNAFAPLPACPPGQLQNAQGLPARPEDVPSAYPVNIPWDGILVDDPNHPLDVERRIHEVNGIIWKGRAEAIEQEASGILGMQSLRDYLRKPTGFFANHLKRHSKSRRQAPIYWPLSTSSGKYTLWIYYHRVTDQTLHTALADFVDPKIRDIERDLAEARSASRSKEVEDVGVLLVELREFRAELERVTRLPWKPNLTDGVLITASPLWKLFRLRKWQKDLKSCWHDLQTGDYDWAHLALSIWPDRVKAACQTDRSIAIAHGLEHLFQEPVIAKRPKRVGTRQAGGSR